LQKQKGIYCLIKRLINEQITLLITASPEYISLINFNKIAELLKNEYKIKSGIQKTSMQGGGQLQKELDIVSVLKTSLI
jgi:retron-type reverse transcriptase